MYFSLISVKILYCIIIANVVNDLELVSCKEYKRCEVVKILEKNSFQRSFIPAWVCLINAESGRLTNKVTDHSNPRHKSYGLFQISSMDYCTPGKKGGTCQAKCEDFLNDDLNDDILCAKMIQEKDGFKHWPKFDSQCKKQLDPWSDEVKKCMATSRTGIIDDGFYLGSGTNNTNTSCDSCQ